MLNVDFNVDLRDTGEALGALIDRQMPFALSLAINTTLEKAQQTAQDTQRYRFKIRTAQSEKFLQNQIQLAVKAKKGNLYGKLQVGDPMAKVRRYSQLPMLEEGGTRSGSAVLGRDGSVFGGVELIPLKKPTPRRLYPANLGLQQRRAIEGGMKGGSLRGKERTFVVRTGPKTGLVLQRTGSSGSWHGSKKKGSRKSKKAGIVALFLIRPSVTVTGRHWFLPAVDQIWEKEFNANVDRALEYALRTAK